MVRGEMRGAAAMYEKVVVEKIKMRRSVVLQHSTVQMFYFRLPFFLPIQCVCVFFLRCFCLCSCLLCFCFHFTGEWRVHFIFLPHPLLISTPLHTQFPSHSHSPTSLTATPTLFVLALHVLRCAQNTHTPYNECESWWCCVFVFIV